MLALFKKIRNIGLVCVIMALAFVMLPATTTVEAATKPKNPRVKGSVENGNIEVTYDLIEFGSYWQIDTNGSTAHL